MATAIGTVFNSREYAWVDVNVVMLGREVVGLRGIEYKSKRQKEALFASGRKARSIQKGKKEYEGTITLLQSELIALNRQRRCHDRQGGERIHYGDTSWYKGG